MSNHYRFRYAWKVPFAAEGDPLFGEARKDIEAPNPISAINQFHRFVQKVKEMADDRRTVLRPALKHDQYVIRSVHQFYHDAALQRNPSEQPVIESVLDYPRSPNPDLLHSDGAGHLSIDRSSPSDKEFDFGPDTGENRPAPQVVSLDDEFQGATD